MEKLGRLRLGTAPSHRQAEPGLGLPAFSMTIPERSAVVQPISAGLNIMAARPGTDAKALHPNGHTQAIFDKLKRNGPADTDLRI